MNFEMGVTMDKMDLTYQGGDGDARHARLEAAAINKLTISETGAASVTVVDGTGMDRENLDATVERACRQETQVLAIFEIAHGVGFTSRRAELRELGAHDVMAATASVDEFLTRVRALLHQLRPPKVLVVEDEDPVAEWAVEALSGAAMDTTRAANLADAFAAFEAAPVDALVVDRQLPDGEGMDLVRRIRELGIRTPALFFTGLGALEDRVRGLSEVGANDYICKPVHADELVARVHVMLRPLTSEQTMVFGPLEIARKDRLIKWRGEVIKLAGRERDFLIYLAERADIPIPQRMIYQDVWGLNYMHEHSNRVTQTRYRMVDAIKKHLADQGEDYGGFVASEADTYSLRTSTLLAL